MVIETDHFADSPDLSFKIFHELMTQKGQGNFAGIQPLRLLHHGRGWPAVGENYP